MTYQYFCHQTILKINPNPIIQSPHLESYLRSIFENRQLQISQSPCFKKRIFPTLHHRSKLYQCTNFSYRTNLQYSITNFIVNSNFHQRILFYYISIVYSAVYPNFALFKLSSTHIILLQFHSL